VVVDTRYPDQHTVPNGSGPFTTVTATSMLWLGSKTRPVPQWTWSGGSVAVSLSPATQRITGVGPPTLTVSRTTSVELVGGGAVPFTRAKGRSVSTNRYPVGTTNIEEEMMPLTLLYDTQPLR